MTYSHLEGRLLVHRAQLRAQRLITGMGSLFLLFYRIISSYLNLKSIKCHYK